jgi:hypothetical protein
MRLWDEDPGSADSRLLQLQRALDELWTAAPADQPVLVRDARWLIPMAQSPATDELGAYFRVADKTATLSKQHRIEIHGASVRMAAGHLRSQTRYFSTKNAVTLDDSSLIRNTRNTNALDFALLIQDLVPLLETYEDAVHGDDRQRRHALADVICQGFSPDPELFVNRVELLGAYSMIEHLFVATDRDGHASYTQLGTRHVHLLEEYTARIGRLSNALHEDCLSVRPVDGAYSPYGALYGFSTT